MKKLVISLMAVLASVGMVAAQSTVSSYAAPQLVNEINTALANPTHTTLTVSGKSTLSGELEVNGASVDINMTTNANVVTIDQTAVAGAANAPLIKITDARTGDTADTAGEATIVIDADGAYGLSVANGIVNIEGEIDSTGDITLDPAGGDVIVDGDLDADSLTVDAGAGLDVQTAGELKIGAAIATAVTIGDAGTTVEIASSDWSVGTDGTIANCAMSADQLTGNIAQARITNALVDAIGPDQMSDSDHGDVAWSSGVATVEAINGVAVATVTAGAAAGATAVQPADVSAAPGITTSTVAAVATAAIQAKDLSGGNNAEYRVIHVWLSDTSMGVASTNNITSLVLSGGTAVSTVTAECDYWYVTAAAGTASAAITGQAAIDKYIMVADGPAVTAQKVTFEP
jgi:hypothetical protein